MLLLINKRAKSEYEIEQKLTAGMVLTGAEVKSLRNKSGSLTGSYVKILGNEAFLLNAQITPYKFANNNEYEPKRTRKLLLKRKEIEKLIQKQDEQKRAIIPLAIVLLHNKIKVELGVGRGLKQFEKRAKVKERDSKRQIERVMKQHWR